MNAYPSSFQHYVQEALESFRPHATGNCPDLSHFEQAVGEMNMARSGFCALGGAALRAATMTPPFPWRRQWSGDPSASDVAQVVSDVAWLLEHKRRTYGPKNLERHGLNGICVRLADKLARYDNLTGASWDESVYRDESLLDTLHDTIGYCVAAVLMIDGNWGAQLAEED